MTLELQFPAATERALFGSFDSNIRHIEDDLGVSITLRNGAMHISGEEGAAAKAASILRQLAASVERGSEIDDQRVNYALDMKDENVSENMFTALDTDCICHTAAGTPVKPKTLGQEQYVTAIRDNMVTFANGPAGTGKTYLAMAMAITAFQNGDVSRIILTRPAIEA